MKAKGRVIGWLCYVAWVAICVNVFANLKSWEDAANMAVMVAFGTLGFVAGRKAGR